MATIAQVKRVLMARVEGIAALEIAATAPFVVTLKVTAAPNVDKDQLSERILNALRDTRPLDCRYEITYDNTISLPSGPKLGGRFSLATIDVDFRRDGMMRGLLKLVPSLSRIVIEEHSNGPVADRCICIRVGAADASSMPKVLADARKAVSAMGMVGLRYEVVSLDQNDHRNELVNCGIPVPRREPRLDRFTEEDEEVFAGRIKRLVADNSDPISLIDGFDGSSVLWGVQFQGGAVPLSCFLPLYDRVLVMMPSGVQQGAANYFQHNFGMSRADFLVYCKHGKVVPIFKFSMGNFPDEVVRPILENPALSFVSPRELDYLAARYAWNDFGMIKTLRTDSEATRALFRTLGLIRSEPRRAGNKEQEFAEDVVNTMLTFSERFEGIMWRQGHLQLANFTPAMLTVRGAWVHTVGDNSANAFTFFTDIMGSATELALAQSMHASLHAGMILNESLFAMVAAQFQGGPAYVTKREAERLPQVLSALDLAYNESISPQEYLDVFDRSETQRIRQIVADVLKNGSDLAKEQEVRERIHQFNQGVKKLRSTALELADVGVLGYTSNGVEAPSGQRAIVDLLGGILGAGLLSRVGADAFDGLIEGTKVASMVDRLRGIVNGVPAQSIRLYRVRRKLGRITGRIDAPAAQPRTGPQPATSYVVNITGSTVGAVAVGDHSKAEGTAGTSDSGSKGDGS